MYRDVMLKITQNVLCDVIIPLNNVSPFLSKYVWIIYIF